MNIVKRWTPKRRDIEAEDGTSLPEWARHLVIGGYRDEGWAAFDQRAGGDTIASGAWGDEIYLMDDGSISCTAYPQGRHAYMAALAAVEKPVT